MEEAEAGCVEWCSSEGWRVDLLCHRHNWAGRQGGVTVTCVLLSRLFV